MQLPKDINEYLRCALAPSWLSRFSRPTRRSTVSTTELRRSSGNLSRLSRFFPAQTLAMMGAVKRWNEARGAAVIAECGTGKTLISLGAVHVHSDRKPFTALAMVPPQLVEKWAREAFLTLPRVRVSFIDGLRTPTSSVGHAGVNEVRLRHGRIVREGLRTTLTELRQRKVAQAVVSVGIPSAGSRRFSSWDAIAGNLVTSGGTRTGSPAAAAIREA